MRLKNYIPIAVLSLAICLSPIMADARVVSAGVVTPSQEEKYANNRYNAVQALKYLDGTLIKPGQIFSFNGTVGKRTTDKGFVYGLSGFEGGYYKDLGGGVCEASTAVYRAASKLNLKMIERHQHNGPVPYAPNHDDAAVDWPYWDLKFKNTLDYPLLVKAYSDGVSMYVDLKDARDEINYGDRRYNVNISLNGQNINFNTKPFILNGTTYVPYRDMAQALNATVEFDNKYLTLTSKLDNNVLKLEVNKDNYYVNDINYSDTNEAQIGTDGKLYVPLRYLLKAFNLKINIDYNNDSVKINIIK